MSDDSNLRNFIFNAIQKLQSPFREIALSLDYYVTSDLPPYAAAANDGKNILLPPSFSTYTYSQARFAIAHEIMHIYWQHQSRLHRLLLRNPSPQESLLWNMICDTFINYYLSCKGLLDLTLNPFTFYSLSQLFPAQLANVPQEEFFKRTAEYWFERLRTNIPQDMPEAAMCYFHDEHGEQQSQNSSQNSSNSQQNQSSQSSSQSASSANSQSQSASSAADNQDSADSQSANAQNSDTNSTSSQSTQSQSAKSSQSQSASDSPSADSADADTDAKDNASDDKNAENKKKKIIKITFKSAHSNGVGKGGDSQGGEIAWEKLHADFERHFTKLRYPRFYTKAISPSAFARARMRTYSRPHRIWGNQRPAVLKVYRGAALILIDVSGSVSDQQLIHEYAIARSIISRYFRHYWLAQFADRLSEPTYKTSAVSVERARYLGNGTEPITAIDDLRSKYPNIYNKLDTIILISDCEFDGLDDERLRYTKNNIKKPQLIVVSIKNERDYVDYYLPEEERK